jgi:spore maturation protein CgeB
MRCFEAMGCGALMVSDEGRYPEGMVDGETMLTYSDPKQAARVIKTAFGTPGRVVELAANGYRVMLTRYNKEQQWHAFRELVGAA